MRFGDKHFLLITSDEDIWAISVKINNATKFMQSKNQYGSMAQEGWSLVAFFVNSVIRRLLEQKKSFSVTNNFGNTYIRLLLCLNIGANIFKSVLKDNIIIPLWFSNIWCKVPCSVSVQHLIGEWQTVTRQLKPVRFQKIMPT